MVVSAGSDVISICGICADVVGTGDDVLGIGDDVIRPIGNIIHKHRPT